MELEAGPSLFDEYLYPVARGEWGEGEIDYSSDYCKDEGVQAVV